MSSTIIVGISCFILGYMCAAIMSANTITELKDELEKRDLDNDEMHTCLSKSFEQLGG